MSCPLLEFADDFLKPEGTGDVAFVGLVWRGFQASDRKFRREIPSMLRIGKTPEPFVALKCLLLPCVPPGLAGGQWGWIQMAFGQSQHRLKVERCKWGECRTGCPESSGLLG